MGPWLLADGQPRTGWCSLIAQDGGVASLRTWPYLGQVEGLSPHLTGQPGVRWAREQMMTHLSQMSAAAVGKAQVQLTAHGLPVRERSSECSSCSGGFTL